MDAIGEHSASFVQNDVEPRLRYFCECKLRWLFVEYLMHVAPISMCFTVFFSLVLGSIKYPE